MGFSDFYGNPEVVRRLRERVAGNRFPHAVILAGPAGSGKYTLALMLAKVINCLEPGLSDGLPDFCGHCSNCSRIAQSEELAARTSEAIEAREGMREADKRDTRIFVQTHSDVLIIPPDPPQMMIKVDQVRRVTETIYLRPGEGKERIYIFTDSVFLREAANALLKVLEEPPEFATILLLTTNPGALLPTIRSRSMLVTLNALAAEEIERYLAQNCPAWNGKERALVARLAEGAVGRARSFDLAAYRAARQQAWVILNSALRGGDHAALFQVTESYRAGAEGRDKIERLVRMLYSLLRDLLYLNSGAGEFVRNLEIEGELKKLAQSADFAWISEADERLADVERGLRRNLQRSLSLDAFVAALDKTSS